MNSSWISLPKILAGNGDRADDFVPLALRFSLESAAANSNEDDEPQVNIAVNLGPLVAPAGSTSAGPRKASSAADRLIPHFRLLRICIAAQNDDDLTDIDALLGCPLWLPKPEVIEKFECLSMGEKNAACSMLFYALNWFRELLNGFADQSDADYRNKILLRLKNLLELERDLSRCLRLNMSFVPPVALHLVDTTGWQSPAVLSAKSGKKTTEKTKDKGGLVKGNWRLKRKNPLKSPENNTTAVTVSSQDPPSVKTLASAASDDVIVNSGSINMTHYVPFFRELDLSVFKILSYDTVKIGSKGTWADEMIDPKLRPPELNFLLSDLHAKLHHALLGSRSKKVGPFGGNNPLKSAGFAKLDQVGANAVAEKAVGLLEYIMADLEETSEYFKRLIDLNDGLLEGIDKFFGEDETALTLISAMEKSFLILNCLFNWSGFQSQNQTALLKKALVIIGRRSKPDLNEKQSIDDILQAAIQHMERFGSTVMNIASADGLIKVMEALLQFGKPSKRVSQSVTDTCEEFLKRHWMNCVTGDKDKGSKFNSHVESLLKLFLGTNPDPYCSISKYVESRALEEVLERDSDYQSSVYPTFNKQTLGLHYRVLLHHLVCCIRNSITFGTTKDHEAQYEIWSKAVDHLHKLVLVLKVQGQRQLILSVIKNARQFIDHFLKHGMPLLDTLFRSRKDDCIELLKSLQLTTRYLQHVCSYSKITKDVSLSNHVPFLKKSLESFVFRVKAMLATNNVVEAFWIGNLKNRDLKGDVISSQEPQEDEDENNDEQSDQSEVELSDNESVPATHVVRNEDDNESAEI